MIRLISFGAKYGPLDEKVTTYDARPVRNPHKVAQLRPLDGRDDAVRRYVIGDPKGADMAWKISARAMTFPAEAVAVACYGGRHRSVAIVEEAARTLRALGFDVSVTHRDVDRHLGIDVDNRASSSVGHCPTFLNTTSERKSR